MLKFRFIAGIAAGALAVVAFNNRKSLKSGVDKTKEVASDIKDSAKATVDCIKSKKSQTTASEVVQTEDSK